MQRATKAQLLTPAARPLIEVDVPGLELSVAVRQLTALEQAMCLAGLVCAEGIIDIAEMQARQLAACLVDPMLTICEAREVMTYWPASAVSAIIAGAGGEDE